MLFNFFKRKKEEKFIDIDINIDDIIIISEIVGDTICKVKNFDRDNNILNVVTFSDNDTELNLKLNNSLLSMMSVYKTDQEKIDLMESILCNINRNREKILHEYIKQENKTKNFFNI